MHITARLVRATHGLRRIGVSLAVLGMTLVGVAAPPFVAPASAIPSVAACPPVITSAAPATSIPIGIAFSHTVTASGTGPITFSISPGALPTGLALNASSGVISGTPTAAGTFNFTVVASNGSALGDTRAYTINVVSIRITSGPPNNAYTTFAYSHTVTAVVESGSPVPTFSVVSGSLPTGLSLNASSGVISGTPSATGTFNFTIRATSGILTDQAAYSVVILSWGYGSSPYVYNTAPNGYVANAYSFTFGAFGAATITYSLVAGSLPAGLSMSSAGVLSGTPTTASTYNFTVRASNGSGTYDKSNTVVIAVAPVAPTSVTSGTPVDGVVGISYSHTLAANGGASTFTITAGCLPPGLTLNGSTGVIAGTPTLVGLFEFTVTASNYSGSASGVRQITIVQPVVITSAAPASGVTGVAYSHTFTATGTGPITYSVSYGSLPPGLSLDTSTGVISGTPTAAGSYGFSIRGANSASHDDEEYTVVVRTAPTITSAAPGGGVIGTAYSHTVTATGTGPITYSVSAGTLPAGLSLNASSGVISGTPTTGGSSSFSITATNTAGTDVKAYTVGIGTVPQITSASPPAGVTGVAYSHTVTATGTGPITFAVSVGSLPPGVTLNATTGVISGTPTTAGSYSFSVRASNVAGSDVEAYTVTVRTAAHITSPAPPSAGRPGVAYSHTVTASGLGPITLAVSAGSLPPGLTFDPSTGVITGTPTTVGVYAFSISASNEVGTDAVDYSVAIAEPPAITAPAPAASGAGAPFSFEVTTTGTGPFQFAITAGLLPTGLVLDTATGVISGTPTTPGSYAFTVSATNPSGTAAKDYVLDIALSAAPAAADAPTQLPTTGVDAAGWLRTGLVLLLLGAACHVIARRRTHRPLPLAPPE